MTIHNKKYNGKLQIDLHGPEGNAFCLMGHAQRFCKQLNKDSKDILSRMQSGDYDNLVSVFDAEFGEYVDLYR